MLSRLICIGLLVLALTAPAAAEVGDVLFLPGATAAQVVGGQPTLDLLTWELPAGLLVVDRRASGQPALAAAPLAPRFPDAEWYLVDRPRSSGGHAGDASVDPAAFGHVHLETQAAWLVEVPRARLDGFLAAGFELQYLDRSPVVPSPRVAAAGQPVPLPTVVDPSIKAAYVDDLDQQALNQLHPRDHRQHARSGTTAPRAPSTPGTSPRRATTSWPATWPRS